VGKILNQQGEGDLSTLLQGFRWLLSIANEKHIRIINISISSASFSRESEKHQLYALFQTAYQNNISVVTAAGNQGPTGSSISLLGDSPYVICVGCHEGRKYKGISKKCQECSGRGPGLNVYRKPDVVAPGTDIVSCGLSKTQYVKKSGTSMAAPIVSGLIALAIEQNPRISAQEVKRRLIRSADDLGENYLMQGFGMVNVERMLAL
jgi:serine protease AprX